LKRAIGLLLLNLNVLIYEIFIHRKEEINIFKLMQRKMLNKFEKEVRG